MQICANVVPLLIFVWLGQTWGSQLNSILFGRWTLWGLHCQRPHPPPNPTSLQLHPQARAHRGGSSCPRWISRLPADHLWGQPRVQQVDVCRERTRRLLVSVRLMFWWSQDHRTWDEGRITWSLNCRRYPGNIAVVVLSTFSLSDLTAFPSCSIKESVCSLVKRWLELLSLYLCITRKKILANLLKGILDGN